MGSAVERAVIPYGEFELLREARNVIDEEARALARVAAGLDQEFCKAAELLCHCAGCVVVTGMGKAGLIGRKIAATLSSTGTRAHFLHPAEAAHGDLGCLGGGDVLIVLSNSGETDEVCRILPGVARFGIPIIAITSSRASTVGKAAAAAIELGRLREAGPHALAPSTTTTAMLAVGDALALVVGRRKGFTPQQFALYHAGGSLGAMLKTVGEIMRTGDQLRIAAESKSIRDVFADSSRPGRRTGAVILVDRDGRLSGLFTDSDLARLLERRQDSLLDGPIADAMTRSPLTIEPAALLSEAIAILSQKRISELPVVDSDGRPLGILDITDIVGTGLLNSAFVGTADSKDRTRDSLASGSNQGGAAPDTAQALVPRKFGSIARHRELMPQARKRSHRTSRSDGLATALYSGSLFERLSLTLLIGAVLSSMFLGYREATRSLRPMKVQSARRTRPVGGEAALYVTEQSQAVQKAQKFLPDTWVAKASRKIQTADELTFCYFEEWKQESDYVVRFSPFALISSRKSAPGEEPYTVVSEKAYVTFKDKVGPAGKNPGPIVRAGLEGRVEIRGPKKLKIQGKNFFFEREGMRIYSDSFVAIQADRHNATAKGIQLELIAEEKAKSDEAFAIAGVSSVKLLQNVDMTLVSAEDAQRNPLPGGPARSAAKSAKGPQVVKAHCDGSFVFYVESRIANFERNVRIVHETAPSQFDSLSTDETVEIAFEPKRPGDGKVPAPTGTARATPTVAVATKAANGKANPGARSAEGLDPNMTFKSVHAQGKVVELVSDSNGLRSLMREFNYDQNAREAKLAWIARDTDRQRVIRDKKGIERKTSGAQNCVSVRHHENLLHAQKIQLNHDPQGEVTHVLCLGEGDMQHVDEKSRQVDLTAEWRKEMRKYPDPKSPNFDLIHLEEALIEQPKEGSGIAANFIRLWVTRQSRNGQSARANLPSTVTRQQPGPHLDHMLAWQKVGMVSPQFECDTDHLEVWFDYGVPAKQRNSGDHARQRVNLVPTSDRVEYAPLRTNANSSFVVATSATAPSDTAQKSSASSVGSPDARNKSPQASKSLNGSKPLATDKEKGTGKDKPNAFMPGGGTGEPFNLTAARVRVHVLQGPEGQQPQVADVIAKGDVHLTQAHGEAAEPLIVEGNELQVQNRGELDQDLIVLGQPAHVRDRGAHIEGSRVRFNRLQNTADVDGAGRLQLPVQQQAADDANNSAPAQPSQPLDVVWRQKMHFDGKTAHFVAGVHTSLVDAESQSEIRCSNMDVTLTKPFSFSDQKQSSEQPAVETVFCDGEVEFDSKSTMSDQLMEVRRGRFVNLTFHKPTGKSRAAGPGMLRVWRHNDNGQSGLTQFSNVHSNAPPKSRKKSNWEFMEIKFSGRMDGDFSQMLAAKSRTTPQPKIRTTTGTNSVLNTGGAWSTTFYDHVEVLYGPVEQPMEVVSRDDPSEESGCLLCEQLQVTQHPPTSSVAQHIEMLAKENAQIEGKTFRGEADTISYDGSKSLYLLLGDKDRPAHLWRQVKVGSDQKGTDAAHRIWFNPITHMVKQDASTQLDFSQ